MWTYVCLLATSQKMFSSHQIWVSQLEGFEVIMVETLTFTGLIVLKHGYIGTGNSARSSASLSCKIKQFLRREAPQRGKGATIAWGSWHGKEILVRGVTDTLKPCLQKTISCSWKTVFGVLPSWMWGEVKQTVLLLLVNTGGQQDLPPATTNKLSKSLLQELVMSL